MLSNSVLCNKKFKWTGQMFIPSSRVWCRLYNKIKHTTRRSYHNILYHGIFRQIKHLLVAYISTRLCVFKRPYVKCSTAYGIFFLNFLKPWNERHVTGPFIEQIFPQLRKKTPLFPIPRMFITIFTRARHWSWVKQIHFTSLTSTLIISSNLRN